METKMLTFAVQFVIQTIRSNEAVQFILYSRADTTVSTAIELTRNLF